MNEEIVLPQLGDGIETGDVVNILVSKGDDVTKDSILMELETDKAVIEFPSPREGKIESIRVKKGDTVKVGQVLFTLEISDSASAKTENRKQTKRNISQKRQQKLKRTQKPPDAENRDSPISGEQAGRILLAY